MTTSDGRTRWTRIAGVCLAGLCVLAAFDLIPWSQVLELGWRLLQPLLPSP